MKKHSYSFLLAPFFFLLVFLSGCSSSPKEQNEESVSTVLPEERNEVQVIKLEYTDFEHELVANGTIEAKNKANLFFEVSEIIASISVKNGDRVNKGQEIACLDQFKLRNSLDQAKDNLERSRLELQDVLIGQGYSLNDSVHIPPEIMQLAKVRSNFEQARIQYELADYNFKKSILYAPFSGVVADLFDKPYNRPDASRPFCVIIDNGHLEASFSILESELALVKPGDKVEITPYASTGSKIQGRVSEINPAVDKNGMVKIKATVSDPGNQLYDGMNLLVRIQRSLGKQLVIPKTALVLRTNKKVVFTYKNGLALWNYVQTGFENSSSYVITEGLSPGDTVIYKGNVNLAHESPVEIKN